MEIKMWREILNPYELAVKELTLKFEHLIKEHHDKGYYSSIERVEGRVKTISRVAAQLLTGANAVLMVVTMRLSPQFTPTAPRLKVVYGKRAILATMPLSAPTSIGTAKKLLLFPVSAMTNSIPTSRSMRTIVS